MRSRLKRTHIVGALALVSALAVSGVSWGVHPGAQTIEGEFQPDATPKKGKPVPGALRVKVTTTDDPADEDQIPEKTSEAIIDIDDDFKTSQQKFPTCDPATIENTTTSQATAPAAQGGCGEAVVGSGSATAVAQFGTGAEPFAVPAVITAFNGTLNRLLLHARAESVNLTQVIKGTFSNSPLPDFGTRVTFPVEPLAGGTAGFSEFEVTLNATIKKGAKSATASKKKKKKIGYVAGRCKDKDQTWNYSGQFTYGDDHPVEIVTDQHACTVKGKK